MRRRGIVRLRNDRKPNLSPKSGIIRPVLVFDSSSDSDFDEMMSSSNLSNSSDGAKSENDKEFNNINQPNVRRNPIISKSQNLDIPNNLTEKLNNLMAEKKLNSNSNRIKNIKNNAKLPQKKFSLTQSTNDINESIKKANVDVDKKLKQDQDIVISPRQENNNKIEENLTQSDTTPPKKIVSREKLRNKMKILRANTQLNPAELQKYKRKIKDENTDLNNVKIQKTPLNISEPNAIICYYNGDFSPPADVPLVFQVNNQKINPKYLNDNEANKSIFSLNSYSNSKDQKEATSPHPPINLCKKPPPIPKKPSPLTLEKSQNSILASHDSSSENDSLQSDSDDYDISHSLNDEAHCEIHVNKKYMPADTNTKFCDQFTIPIEEQEQAFDDQTALRVEFQRTPTLDILYIDRSSKSNHDIKRSHRNPKASNVISLCESQKTSIHQTDPDLAPMIKKCKEQMSNGFDNEYDRDISLNITSLSAPPSTQMTTFEQDGKIFVDAISKDAFEKFQFGPSITCGNSDQFHIIAWHNLSLSPNLIADKLNEHALLLPDDDINLYHVKCFAQYIFLWLIYFPDDFYENQACAEKINESLNVVLNKIKSSKIECFDIQETLITVKIRIESLKKHETTPEEITAKFIQRAPVPSGISNIDSYSSYRLMDLKVEISVLAKHFTFIELELFRKIPRKEFIKLNWTSKDRSIRESHAPWFSKFLDRFNSTSVFIATSILVNGSKNRANKIVYWIKVMEEAKKIRNFVLLFEIDAALSSYPINRLEGTWKHVSKKYISLFNKLHRITNPVHQSIIDYKREISKNIDKTLPFIGPYLTDLMYIYEGNSKTKVLPDNTEGYNMKSQIAYANIVNFICQEWGSKMEFHLDVTLLEKCRQLKGRCADTKQLLIPSMILEPCYPNENVDQDFTDTMH